MKSIKNILDRYDSSDTTDRKKILIIEWFQKHPGNRFDISEIQQELGESLDVGRTRTSQILNDLEDDSVLESYGKQRKAYQLSEDIVVPIKYQTLAGLRHLWTVVDIKRWGIAGIFAISTVFWLFLTLPFWFFSVVLLVSPKNRLGPFSESELIVFALAMTIWLLVFVILLSIIQLFQRWSRNRTSSSS